MTVSIHEILTETTHLSGNPIWVKVHTTQKQGFLYKVLLKVESVDGALPGSPFVDDNIPDANGNAWFNISALVDQYVLKDFNWPLSGHTRGYPGLIFDISLCAGETYIDAEGNRHEQYGTPQQPFFIVKGKLPKIKLAELFDNQLDWFGYFPMSGRFLTWLPQETTVSPYQPVKLWMKSAGGITFTLSFRVQGTYENGHIETVTNDVEIYRDMLHEFNLQPGHIGLPLEVNGSKLTKYEAWATGGLVPMETRTFLIDWDFYPHYYYLFVDNQIGGIDCLWLSGEVQYAPTGKRHVAERKQERWEGIKIPSKVITANNRQRRWKINSGIKLKDELATWEVLLDTPNAWLAIPPEDGSVNLRDYSLTPVIITNTEFVLNDSSENIESIDIELTEAH